jgi:hypothetical protein
MADCINAVRAVLDKKEDFHGGGEMVADIAFESLLPCCPRPHTPLHLSLVPALSMAMALYKPSLMAELKLKTPFFSWGGGLAPSFPPSPTSEDSTH